MTESTETLEQQEQLVQTLRTAVYSQTDPLTDPDLHSRLVAAEARLREWSETSGTPQQQDDSKELAIPAPRGRLLGPETTGLKVESTLHMQPIPTGIYHLLDPETDPLVTVSVFNARRETRRLCIKVYLEGLSAQAVRTVEVKRDQTVPIKMLPILLPERARLITEVQRATLHVMVEDLDHKPECHDTFSVVCLARTSSFNSVRKPETGERVDLSHYYGAWVTPYVESVQERIRAAADLSPKKQLWGYQISRELVNEQVSVLYQSLKEANIVYINSIIDYRGIGHYATQRTRLPSESIASRSANCIDGTVLMASLLEGTSLNPVLVLVPGHAFVGWETWRGSGEWRFLETTMIGSSSFAQAMQSAQRQYDAHQQQGNKITLHPVSELRKRGIWPME